MFFSNVIIYSSNSSSLLFRWLLLKWLLQTFIFYKTPLGETRCLSIYLFIYFFFLNAQASSFLVRSRVTYGTLCHARGHPHSYLGKQKISLGVAIILSICLCSHAQLHCNQFVINPKFVFMHVNAAKVLLVVKTLLKNIDHQPN